MAFFFFFSHTHVLDKVEHRNWGGGDNGEKIHLICTSSNPEKEQLWEKSMMGWDFSPLL